MSNLTEAVNSHQPDLVLLTGDLVHIGLESEMIEAANWLRHLGPPEKVMFVPGNHDNYARDSLAAMYQHWGGYLPAASGLATDYTAGYPMVRETQDVQPGWRQHILRDPDILSHRKTRKGPAATACRGTAKGTRGQAFSVPVDPSSTITGYDPAAQSPA